MNDIREEIIETESSIRRLNEALSKNTLKNVQFDKVITLLEQNRTDLLEDRNLLAAMGTELRASTQQVGDAHERLKETHENNAATAATLRGAMSELGDEVARIVKRVDQANSQLLENSTRASRLMDDLRRVLDEREIAHQRFRDDVSAQQKRLRDDSARLMEELEGQRLRASDREAARQKDQQRLISRITLIVVFSVLSLGALAVLVVTSS